MDIIKNVLKPYWSILISLIIIIFTFTYKNQICYLINDQILNHLNLEFIDDIGILFRIIYFSAITAIALYLYNFSRDWKILLIYSIAIIGWVFTWKSPFSEGKELSIILKKN